MPADYDGVPEHLREPVKEGVIRFRCGDNEAEARRHLVRRFGLEQADSFLCLEIAGAIYEQHHGWQDLA